MKSKTRTTAAMLAAGSTLVTALPSDAGNGPQVQGAKVRHGSASFERNGDNMRIRTGRTTVIDYSRFDIPVGSSVQFLQPDAKSRVLNRITSDAPTMIMGSLTANGRVYFVNRAGVVFGKDARIDVGALFAAAGDITNRDFLAGRDVVTGMTGSVQNMGSIRAGEVVLAGRTVVNSGTIDAGQGGLVAMVSGDSVTLRRNGSSVGVRVSGGSAAMLDGAGIVQTGTIRAPGGRIVATAGDLASLAVDLEGSVIARAVEINGGPSGTVRVAGSIDVSGAANGTRTGGTVAVTGQNVQLTETANIDASGPKGGGTVLIGGGIQGQNSDIQNAQTLGVAAGAVVNADATVKGDGGTVVFWSDDQTSFYGSSSARGAGAKGQGGFTEVSGKKELLFEGVADLRGSGTGDNGTLLLDPGFFVVQNAAGGVNTISIPTLNGQLALGSVVLTTAGAAQDSGIRWDATLSLSGLNSSNLTLNATQAGAEVLFNRAPAFGTWTGDFNVIAPTGPVNIGHVISRPNGGNMSFTSGAGMFININGGTISTSAGNVSFNGDVRLGANTTISAGTGNIFFSNIIEGVGANRNLTVNNTGTTNFSGAISGIGQFTTNAGGTSIFGASVFMAGNSAINDAVQLTAGNHDFMNTGAALTTFGSTVNGPGSLDYFGGTGTLTFLAPVGSGSALAGINITSSGAVNFNSVVDGAMDVVIITPGTTTFKGAVGSLVALNSINVMTGKTVLNAGYVRTTGAQNYQALGLGFATTDIIASDVTIAGAFNRSGGGLRDVTFTVPGTVSLLGATTQLFNVTSDAGGTFFVAAPFTISGLLTVDDTLSVGAPSVVMGATQGFLLQNVTGNGNSLTLNSPMVTNLQGNVTGVNNFTSNAPGSFVLGGDITATGNVSIFDPMTLAGAGATRTITTSGAGNVTLNGALNGAKTLDVFAGTGTVLFGGAIGGTQALDAINVNSSGAVTFDGTVNGATDLTVNTTGLTTFDAAIGATTALNFVNVSGPMNFSGGTVRTTGAQDYGNATLDSNTTLTSTGGADIHMHGTVDGARSLTVNTAGTTILDGAVGVGTALTSLTATGGNVLFNGGAVTTTGAQTYGNATLGADLTITSTGGSAVGFTGTIDGAQNLAVVTSGNTTLGGAVGSGTALSSINIGRTTFNNGVVNTTGAQTFGNSTLNAATTLTSSGGGDVTFTGTVNGAQDLIVNTAGDTIFGGTVGNSTALNSVTALGDVQINSASVRTSGAQTYGNVSLGANSLLSSTGGGDIMFGGTLAGTGGQNLTVNTSGVTTFSGAVSGVGDLTTDAAGSNAVNADITGSGDIALNGATALTGATRTITSTGGMVSFGGALDGATNLVVNAAGVTTFGGVVGGGTALASVTAAGPVALNGGAVTTTGAQAYGATTLGATTNLTSTGGGAISTGAVTGGGSFLGVHTSGDTTFGGPLSGLSGLLADGGGRTLLGGGVGATGDINFMDDVVLMGGAHGVTSSLGDIMFGGAVDGPGGLSTTAAGLTTFAGPIGGATALADLTTNSSTLFGGGTIRTTGDMNLMGPMTFGADTTALAGGTLTLGMDANAGLFDLSLGAAQIDFASGILVKGRNLTLTGPMHGLGSLALDATDTLTLRGDLTTDAGLTLGTPSLLVLGGSVDSLGDLLFSSAVRVDGNRVVTSRMGGGVRFASTVNGTTFQGDSLLVNSSGLTAFDADVGNTTRMLRLETNHPGTIQVAPFANAVTVIYGELIGPGPDVPGGGVALAQSFSAIWESLVATLADGRRVGMVDYRKSMHQVLTADLNAGIESGGLAATGVADSTPPE